MTETTCQICGRAILARTGVIAHHGYRRPLGWHAQTASCFGARFVPYEAGHDALDRYVPIIEDLLARTITRRADLIANPPATVEIKLKRMGYPTGEVEVFERPAGFDPVAASNQGSYRPRTYAGWFTAEANRLRNEIAGLTAELAYLRDRRAAWRAPPVEAA